MNSSKIKDNAINIFVLIFGAVLIVGYIAMDYSWFTLDNKMESRNKEREEKNARQLYYNSRIKQIYTVSKKSINRSIGIIDSLKISYPEHLSDLKYVSARIYLQNDSLIAAKTQIDELMIADLSNRSKFEELLAYYYIEINDHNKAKEALLLLNKRSTNYRFQLGTYYEVNNNDSMAMVIYDEIISNTYSRKKQAEKRRGLIEEGENDKLNNIILSNDAERVYFSIGNLNLY